MNENIAKWKKYLDSLSVEYIVANSETCVAWEGKGDRFTTFNASVKYQLNGLAFFMRTDGKLAWLSEEEDRELFEATDLSNFKEAIRVMTL